MNKYLVIAPEVEEALENNMPVVALESTIISHGFNYPENLECAAQCENIIRQTGAIPATIGIVKGKLKVGLNSEEIEYFSRHSDIEKCSRRDVPTVISRGGYGAATVATTMMSAKMAGIKIFATGGIGGVHRGAPETFDISADLKELANTDVAVVCAGIKSILDVALTREYLETEGVPVIGYRTEDFPSFYTRISGTKVDYAYDIPEDIAKMLIVKHELGLRGGVLIANPIPEEDSLDYDYIENSIIEALKAAKEQGISGKAATPFLLDKLQHITNGKSVAANKALVYNNAKVAAEIAIALSSISG